VPRKQHKEKQPMKELILMIATVCVIGCANPQFEQYARARQTEIARMPNGSAKQQAQADLNAKRQTDDQRKKANGADTAAIIGSTILFGVPGLLISGLMVGVKGSGDGKRNRELNEEAKRYNQEHAANYAGVRR
jgi:hypothetical protein